MPDDQLLAALRAVVGSSQVVTDPEVCVSYEVDWTGRFRGRSRAVVRPATTPEVAAVLAACTEHGATVVPQGGNTGLVGGSVPRGGEVLLSLRRVAAVGPVDLHAAQLTVGAGCTLASARQAARAVGLDIGVDLAPRESATVGGMVATNAGGQHVLRHGSMRRQVAGLEAVLADGSVVRRLAGLAKDNTGYDLPSLITGSEGTLAVVTAVRLQLVPVDRHRTVALLALAATADIVPVLVRARAGLTDLNAAEFFLAAGSRLVRAHRGLPPAVVDSPVYLLLETGGGTDSTDDMVRVLADAPGVLDAAVASSAADREALWTYREAHTEAINALGTPVKLDVAVPLPALAGLLDDLPSTVAAADPTATVILFGHAAEGNVHVNVLGARDAEAVENAVLRRVVADDGSISAEHGIGVAKTRWLTATRSPPDIAAMRAIKDAWDPGGTLNPGVLFGPTGRGAGPLSRQ